MVNKETITKILLPILLVIIVLSVVSGLASNIDEAGDRVSTCPQDNCSVSADLNGNALTINFSASPLACNNDTQNVHDAGCTAPLPLTSLFSSNGVIILTIVGFIFVGLVMLVLKRTSGK